MFRLIHLTLCIFVCCCAASYAKDEGQQRTITVTQEHRVTMAPDVADITISAYGEAKEAKAAQETAQAQLSSVVALAKNYGIEKKHLKVSSVSLQPRYHYETGSKRVLEGYAASYTIEITLRDVNQVGALLGGLAEKNITRINNVRYSLQDSTQPYLKALNVAVDKATIKARSIAAAAGVSLGNVVRINEGGTNVTAPPPIMMRSAAFASEAQQGGNTLPAGELEVSARITIIFALDN